MAKNIMVFAPHPDDEILMSAGAIADGITRGDTVTVVVVTNGDISGVAKGYTRERESVAALAYLGLNDQKIVFLGYGDGSTIQIYKADTDTSVITSPAGQTQTYGDQGLGFMDYHRYRTGASAPYTRANILGDIQAIISAVRPRDVYLTSIYDDHPDHRATGLFATEAIMRLKRLGTGSVERIHESIVHAPCEFCDPNYHWPEPTFTPTSPFPQPPYLQAQTPLVWTQIESVPVPASMQSTDQATNTKYQAISRHATQTSPYLYSFVKSNEFAWVADLLNNFALTATATASSSLPESPPSQAIDGFVDGAPRDAPKEWATQGELTGGTLTLTWPGPTQITRIGLHDRTDSTQNVTSGTLTFSDGSTIAVGALPNDGEPLFVTFATKAVTSVSFRIDSSQGTNPGLAEFEAYGPAAAEPPNNAPEITSGPTATPSVINDTQTSTVTVSATDADGDPLSYFWSSNRGTITGSGTSVVFHPPTLYSTTTFTVQVIVRDDHEGSTFGTASVTVSSSAVNLALNSSVTVSSENAAQEQLGIKAIDGVIDGYPGDFTKEWAAMNEVAGAWIRLTWSQPEVFGSIVLYDRPNLTEHIQSGTLSFSDGSSVAVDSLPNDGAGLVVTFPPRQATWVEFRVTSGTGSNIGLAEFQAFGPPPDPSDTPPHITAGPTATPASIDDSQTSALSVTATDPNGDPLTYSWSASGGTIAPSGSSATYTPPGVSAVSTFTVYVNVHDGRGGIASGNTPITVTPGPTRTNFARSSTVTVSSERPATGQQGIKAIDGVISGNPVDPTAEWVTMNEVVGAWIRLTWSQTHVLTSARLFDRPNLVENIQSGRLLFSDGSTVSFGALPNNGTALIVNFPAREVSWIELRVDSGTGQNIGLSEFEVYGTQPEPGDTSPVITAGPTANPDSIPDNQSSTVSVTATDVDGDPLSYAWSASAGTVAGSGSSATYTPPAVPAATAAQVHVTVGDGRGGMAFGSATVYVSPSQPNSAQTSTVTVSSENVALGQLGIKAIDGVIDGYPGDQTKEWATLGEIAGAWIRLTWSAPQTIGSVVLYDRPNLDDHVTAGSLSFSDGSSVAVGALPNGGSPYTSSFSARQVTWVEFRVTSGTGQNIGLAEVQTFATAPNNPPQILAGPTATPASINDIQTSAISVSASDPDGHPLTYAWTPTGGSIFGSGPNVTFTPPAVVSPTTFTVSLSVDDGQGGTATGSTSVDVSRHNTSPHITAGPAASPDSISDAQTSTLSVTATDAESDPLTYAWTPSGGSISGSGASVTFTPPAVASPTTFTVSLSIADGHGGTATDSTSVKVSRHNTAPQITAGPAASPDSINDLQTSALSVTVTDADGDPLTYTWTRSGGTISGTGASVTFTPPAVVSTTTFTTSLSIDDAHGGTATGSTGVKVSRHNTAPQITVGPAASPDSINDLQTSTLSVTATDADGDPLTYTWTPSGGTVSGTGASVTFTPPAVVDTTRFTVSLSIDDAYGGAATGSTSVKVSRHNTAPQITAGPTASPDSITDTQTSTIAVSATDAEGDLLTYAWTPSGGSISGTGASVTFTPPAVTTATVFSISLSIDDAHGGTTNGATSVKVWRHNNAPQIALGPTAVPDSIADNQASTITAVASDPDGDALTYAWTPSGGTISGSGASVTFTPPSVAATTTFSISLTVSDGLGGAANGNSSVKVTAHNTPPQITAGPAAAPDSITDLQTSTITAVATDLNGDPLTYAWTSDGGSISGSGPSVTFTPPAVATTTVFTVSLEVSDGHGGTANGSTPVKVTRQHNTAPQITAGPAASPDSINDVQTSTLSVTATDADGDPLTYTWTPSGGSISGAGASVTFTPPAVVDTTRFTVSLSIEDGHGGKATGGTSVKVSHHNTAPQITAAPAASPDSINDLETSTLSVTATDADGDPLTYTWTPSGGSISGSGASVTFTPPAVASTTTFTVALSIEDGHGGTATGGTSVKVSRHNTAPQITAAPAASPDSINDLETSTLSVTATDADGDPLTYTWTPSGGTISGSGASVTFTPPAFASTTTFTISLSIDDAHGGTATGGTSVKVLRHNTAPQITADASSTPDSITDLQTSTLSVTATDAEGDPLTYTWTPSGGTISGTGASVTFTPPLVPAADPDPTNVTISLAVRDGHGGVTTGDITLNVKREHNTAPQIASGPRANPNSINAFQISTITVDATDADAESVLFYAWTVDGGGTLTGGGATVAFRPPDVAVPTPFTISVIVTDPLGLTVSGNVVVNVSEAPVTAVGEEGRELVAGFRLRNANPMRDRAEFAFTVPREGNASAIVYDFRGRVVAILVDGRSARGVHAIHWDGRTVSGQRAASGTYFVRARLDGRTIATPRITILR